MIISRPFLYTISFLALSTFLFAFAGILFVIDFYTGKIHVIDDRSELQADVNAQWRPIVMAVFSGVLGIFCFLDLRLIFFHIFLIRNNLTTYQYIMREREKKTLKESNKSRTKNKKVTPAPSAAPSGLPSPIVTNIASTRILSVKF